MGFGVLSISIGILGKGLTRPCWSFCVLVFQGCDSEISSMVTEARRKVADCMNTALKTIGLLAAVNGTDLHLTELGSEIIDSVSRFPHLLHFCSPIVKV